MFNFEYLKRLRGIDPLLHDNTTAIANVFDMAGVHKALIVAELGVIDAAVTVLKLQGSEVLTDATTLATPSDITGTIFGTSVDPLTGVTSTTPADTQDGKAYRWILNCHNQPRYVQIVAVAGNGTTGVNMAASAYVITDNGPLASGSDSGFAGTLVVN